ncbi:hypothetical protein LXL04_002646 [Taraxacum kok-saghyz]
MEMKGLMSDCGGNSDNESMAAEMKESRGRTRNQEEEEERERGNPTEMGPILKLPHMTDGYTRSDFKVMLTRWSWNIMQSSLEYADKVITLLGMQTCCENIKEVIEIDGSDPSCADYLKGLIESVQYRLVAYKNSGFHFKTILADDCFLLASRCIRYCPHLLLPSPVFSSLVECSMTGITLQHMETSNSILKCVCDSGVSCNRHGKSRFLQALSDAALGVDIKGLKILIDELSDVCRQNNRVQEIVQEDFEAT